MKEKGWVEAGETLYNGYYIFLAKLCVNFSISLLWFQRAHKSPRQVKKNNKRNYPVGAVIDL